VIGRTGRQAPSPLLPPPIRNTLRSVVVRVSARLYSGRRVSLPAWGQGRGRLKPPALRSGDAPVILRVPLADLMGSGRGVCLLTRAGSIL
jgi:hypothetical protein